MKKHWRAGVALALLVVAGQASAADLPTQYPVQAPAQAAPTPAVSWTGFYAGLGLGFRSSRSDVTTTSVSAPVGAIPLTGDATSQPLDGTAFPVNPYAGLNWQVAPRWVVGVEGDVGFAKQTTTLSGFLFSPFSTGSIGVNQTAADSFAVKTTWDASARGRLGFLVAPTTLIYATGGAAWQHYDVTSTCAELGCLGTSPVILPAVIGNSITRTGWTVGGGIETALWGNWFARADYRYSDFGSSALSITRSFPNNLVINPIVDTFNVALRTHNATLGLAFKFGDPVAPANSGGLLGTLPVKALPANTLPATASWSGLYAGLGAGLRSSRTDTTTTSLTEGGTPVDLTGRVTSEPLDGTAFRVSPYAGYNWQVAPQWVVGIEGDVGFANQTTTLNGLSFSPAFGPFSFSLAADGLAVKTSWDASARGRLGFLVSPTTLVYATGGAAWQRYDVTSTCASVGAGSCAGFGFTTPSVITNSTTKAGWTVGGGIETALWHNWFARGEYRYADFGSAPFTLNRSSTVAAFNPTIDNFNVALRTHTATFGIAYKFDGLSGGVR